MVVAGFYCVWIFYQDAFNGFISAHITTDKVTLRYLWPLPDKEIARAEIQQVESKIWGKNSRILEIMTTDGKKLKSVSGDADDIRILCGDFSRGLGIEPQKK